MTVNLKNLSEKLLSQSTALPPSALSPSALSLQDEWMNPSKVVRSKTRVLIDLPNIGHAIAEDLRVVGIQTPLDLVGKNPLDLYNRLNDSTRTGHDPCVLDVFMSVTDYKAGKDAQPWWAHTKKRKELLAMDNSA